jgi:hypothetical protein
LFVVPPLGGQTQPPKGGTTNQIIEEVWDAAYLNDVKAGFVHTVVRALNQDGQKVFRTTQELDLTVARFGDTAHMFMEIGTDETADGKVIGVSMRQLIAKSQQLILTGAVESIWQGKPGGGWKLTGKHLHVKTQGGAPMDKPVWWNDKVTGLYGEQAMFKQRQPKPGDSFSYMHYEPTLNAVVTMKVSVKDYEEVAFGNRKKRLLRVESMADKVLGMQLPPLTLWLDKDFAAVKSRWEMPGLGTLVLIRSSRKVALEKGGPQVEKIEITRSQLIPLNRYIRNPHDTQTVVYQVSLQYEKGETDPSTVFARERNQVVKNVKGNTFEIHVHAVRRPEKVEEASKAGDEFLKSNYFINCDDVKVKELAEEAVGAEEDPWRKAQKIERWVFNHMNQTRSQNFSEAMATADHVAQTLKGDCTEYAMLAAAMCRAVGVPSRTALGLVYAVIDQRPVLAYHMWTEVWIDGQWLGIDATLGRGFVGADHLKITDHSWYETQSLLPLVPVMRVMLAKPTVEIISVEGADKAKRRTEFPADRKD